MMFDRKYYSIGEVVKKTGISSSRLRQLEKENPALQTVKIRDRRYYDSFTYQYIIEKYSDKQISLFKNYDDIINKIDILVANFQKLL